MSGTPTFRDSSEAPENNPETNASTYQLNEDSQRVAAKLTFETPDLKNCVDTSNHAELRWIQRAHEFEQRASQAWHRAKRVRLDSREFDRVRYDEQTDTLLCVNEETLITILTAKHETFAPISSNEKTTVRCVACGCQRRQSSDECSQCGSEFAADPTYTVTTQEGR